VLLWSDRLVAVGVAIGSHPMAYRLDYRLETHPGFVTSRLQCECRGEGWSRAIDLRRADEGTWSISVRASGKSGLPPPGGTANLLRDAMDCDLGLSPMTNTLPVLREHMLVRRGSFDLVAAWVSVPNLQVAPDHQRYTVGQVDDNQFMIRYDAADGSFGADIRFDHDALVLDYPGIARRL
jgi:hypothetical protein